MSRAVLITRHPADCSELQELLAPSGITLRPYPVLRLVEVNDRNGWLDVRDLLADHGATLWLVMASPRAPERLLRQAHERGAHGVLELPTAVVGDATARAAVQAGFRVSGRDPLATFLTQITRIDNVESVGRRSGLYRLRIAA